MATRSPVYGGNSEFMPNDQNSVYGLSPTSANEKKARKAFRYRTFPCPLCHTEFSVTKDDVGKTLVCPDCETKVVVPSDLNFDIETDYERQYFNADKKKRAKLFSLFHNPNRKGIDLSGGDVYAVKSEKTNKASAKDSEEYYPVICRVCKTQMQAPREMLGKTIKCPDCDTETLVTDALKNQQKTVDVNSDLMPKDQNSIYDVAPTSANDKKARKAFRYRTFLCPICHTGFSVTKDDVGKTLVCPDCETKVVVPADLPFDIETDYERQYFNADKKKRDKLFSPFHNPNRKGIDLSSGDVYAVKSEKTDVAVAKDSKGYYRIICRVCMTLLQAPRKMLGKTIKRSHCGTETIVTDALKNQRKAVDDNSDLMPKDQNSVYDVTTTSTNEEDARKAFRYRTFLCPICHTGFSVTKDDVGKTLVCPDCETKVVVPSDLNFDIETEYERQYFNADKKRRDELFSPLLNPNRQGIDLASGDVYAVKSEKTDAAPSKDTKGYYHVICRFCETLMQALRKMLGKKIK